MKQLLIYIEEEDLKKFKLHALKSGKSMSKIIRTLIKKELNINSPFAAENAED